MQFTSTDLFSGLRMLGLWLAIAGVVVAISIWRARRHGSTTLALDVTRNASLAYLLLLGVGVVMNAVKYLGFGSVTLSDDVRQWVTQIRDSLLGPACAEDGTEPLITPGSTPILLCDGTVENTPIGPRLVILAGTLLGLIASAAITWAIYTATRRAGMREPFHPSVSRTFAMASIVVMASASVGALADSIGMTLAARSLRWEEGVEIPFQLSIPLWPFAVAVGLFALSAIFRYGAQLQRETEGLV